MVYTRSQFKQLNKNTVFPTILHAALDTHHKQVDIIYSIQKPLDIASHRPHHRRRQTRPRFTFVPHPTLHSIHSHRLVQTIRRPTFTYTPQHNHQTLYYARSSQLQRQE